MTVHIEIHQDKTVIEGPVYKIKTSVVYVSGINRNIFVFNTETQEFSHVATTWDMENLPDNRNDALLNDADYYRQSEAETLFENVDTAEAAALYTVARVEYLAKQYSTLSGSFIGSEDYTFEA
jgi:hypothetical protein